MFSSWIQRNVYGQGVQGRNVYGQGVKGRRYRGGVRRVKQRSRHGDRASGKRLKGRKRLLKKKLGRNRKKINSRNSQKFINKF